MTSADLPNPAFLGGGLGQGHIHNIKLVLLGDMAVGKTSIALRFARGTFENNYKQTIGASFVKRVVEVNDYVINFQIWDTAGQERYMALVPMYLRGAQVALIIYDVTDKESFHNLEKWLLALESYSDDTYIVLVANKCDLDFVVPIKEAEQFADDRNLHFIQTSAKTGLNIDKLFNEIGLEIVEKIKQRERELDKEKMSRRRSSAFPSDIILPSERSPHEDKRTQCCHR